MSVYTDNLAKLSLEELRDECVQKYTLFLWLPREERDRPPQLADHCFAECRRRGVVETMWKPIVEEVIAQVRAERMNTNKQV